MSTHAASLPGRTSPAAEPPGAYWEERARRFARRGAGLAAVCSYSMPEFHNRAIDLCQRRALRPWIARLRGATVLDVGCGVGRWSRRLAAQGAWVTGVDLSATMIDEARRRTPPGACDFITGDVTALDLAQRFDALVCVTVLQHVLDDAAFERALAALARHVLPGGQVLALEAAPTRPASRCDSAVFRARPARAWLEAFERHGLRCQALVGVDPAPFRVRFLPHYPRLPQGLRQVALALVTAASLPIDLLAARARVSASWHKLFVLARERER